MKPFCNWSLVDNLAYLIDLYGSLLPTEILSQCWPLMYLGPFISFLVWFIVQEKKTCNSVIIIMLPKCNSVTMIPTRWEDTHKFGNLTYLWVYLIREFQVTVNFDHLLALRKMLCTFSVTEWHNKYIKMCDYPYQNMAYAVQLAFWIIRVKSKMGFCWPLFFH